MTEETLLSTEAPTTTEEPSADQEVTTTEEVTTEEQTSEEETAEQPPEEAPESYDFTAPDTFPEGTEVDEGIADAYSKASRELNLPQDKAQALFQTTMEAVRADAVRVQEAQTEAWTEAAKNDDEFGGTLLQENLGIATKAVDKFGSDGLRELLSAKHGVGNHPEVIRFLHRVGKAISEDRFVAGEQTVDTSDPKQQAAVLYPNSP